MKKPDLIHCPFCRGKAAYETGQHAFTDVFVLCKKCGAEGPVFGMDDTDPGNAEGRNALVDKNMRAAAAHWNRRAEGGGGGAKSKPQTKGRPMDKASITTGIYTGGAQGKIRRVEGIETHPGYATMVVFSEFEDGRWCRCRTMTLDSFARWASRLLPVGENHAGEAASKEELETYQHGYCHVFAIAMAREYGTGIVAVTDGFEPAWQDEKDADNFIPSISHVYAVACETAFDISGSVSLANIEKDCRIRFGTMASGREDFSGEDDLRRYVRDADPSRAEVNDCLPLAPYSEDDIEAARIVVRRIFGSGPVCASRI